MSRVIKLGAVFLLSFVLVACLQKPVFTVEVFKSPTPSPLPPPPTATFTPSAIPTVTFTPVLPVMPSNFSPLLYGKKYGANTFFVLLGGVLEGAWLAPNLAAGHFADVPSWPYDVYSLGQNQVTVQGFALEFSPRTQSYSLQSDSTYNESGMIGVAQGWPVQQGAVQELVSDNDFYRQVVLDWLGAKGTVAAPPNLLRIFRVDIEADGVDEIFISATHLDESQHTTRMGDYSIVLMRKVEGNHAVTLYVAGDMYDSAGSQATYPRTYSLANFIDLNQDGILEVVVDFERWEGFGASIYQIDGQTIRSVP